MNSLSTSLKNYHSYLYLGYTMNFFGLFDFICIEVIKILLEYTKVWGSSSYWACS